MDEAVICPNCGCAQGPVGEKPQDAKSFGWALLGFCIPLVGLILYLVWKDQTPLKAKSCGKGALISVIVSAAAYIIYVLFIAVFLTSLGAAVSML